MLVVAPGGRGVCDRCTVVFHPVATRAACEVIDWFAGLPRGVDRMAEDDDRVLAASMRLAAQSPDPRRQRGATRAASAIHSGIVSTASSVCVVTANATGAGVPPMRAAST